MRAEHFIYGLFRRYGIKLIKSPGINNLLTGEIINYLCQLEKPGTYPNLWPNGTLTITRITKASDEYGRNGTWNHTFVFSLMDYLQLTNPERYFDKYFVNRLEEPKMLESMKID